jgi:hypothetical protein
VIAGQCGELEAWDRGRVREWLAVVTDDLRNRLDRVRTDDELVMLGAELLGNSPGVRKLVESRGIEPDGERLDRPSAGLGHRRDDRGGVDPAGEEGTEGDV